MVDLIEEFGDKLEASNTLVVMPISRLILESPFSIGKFRLYPAGEIDLDSLNIVAPVSFENAAGDDDLICIEGDSLRSLLTSLTGATSEVIYQNASIAFFPERVSVNTVRKTHDDDRELIGLLSQEAEQAMNWLRFKYCRFDHPETLPGTVGTWCGSGAFCGTVLYDIATATGSLVAAESLYHSTVSKGVGLELEKGQCKGIEKLPSPLDGEVGGIVQHALRLFSDILNANTNTSKYLRAMTLFEFLASPFEYRQFKKSKKDIASHIAGDHPKYNSLLDRFRQLSDVKDPSTGRQLGYRTQLIHHGLFLEEIIPDLHQRTSLFKELQEYSARVIFDLYSRRQSTWAEILSYRRERRAELHEQTPSQSNRCDDE